MSDMRGREAFLGTYCRYALSSVWAERSAARRRPIPSSFRAAAAFCDLQREAQLRRSAAESIST
eukprot:CAMPEP_0174848122 /NCGR_PEP_ID=MMETSP1114-20130205/13332_1 /TAXON_ID=312471 /ORGANISM="Neobodo designis, Strain CCAP 1951/1" /LENGTH=63 /DNA_ID=CAMNT_0016082421 /DNA_START=70 /DNA_END=261 /DNA_ORIENTATION=-